MVPTSLPELPKPSRTPGKSQKPEFVNPKQFRKNKNTYLISVLIPFLGPIRGGVFFVPPTVVCPGFARELSTGQVSTIFGDSARAQSMKTCCEQCFSEQHVLSC